jgi:hypothetical protein
MFPEDYDLLVAECDITSREYTILKNGILTSDQSEDYERETIEILCEKGEADLLLDAANRLYPQAAPAIANGIALARASRLSKVSVAGAM